MGNGTYPLIFIDRVYNTIIDRVYNTIIIIFMRKWTYPLMFTNRVYNTIKKKTNLNQTLKKQLHKKM